MFLAPKILGSFETPEDIREELHKFTQEEINCVPGWVVKESFPKELPQFTDEELEHVRGWPASTSSSKKHPPKGKRKMEVEKLTMQDPWHRDFPATKGRLKVLKTLSLNSKKILSATYEDAAQEFATIRLIPKKKEGKPPRCVFVRNPSETASFTYSLHLPAADLVLQQKRIPPNTEHEISWKQSVDGILKWYLHDDLPVTPAESKKKVKTGARE
jgi:hypothetical protein